MWESSVFTTEQSVAVESGEARQDEHCAGQGHSSVHALLLVCCKVGLGAGSRWDCAAQGDGQNGSECDQVHDPPPPPLDGSATELALETGHGEVLLQGEGIGNA